MNYYWVRIFDYKNDDELKTFADISDWEQRKGTLLDEYYLCGEAMTREEAKEQVRMRSGVSRFAKPRKKDGIYAIVLDSEKFFYERFTTEIDTICFNPKCNKSIKGKIKDFPYIKHNEEKYYCCSYDCKHSVLNMINPYTEGEFQERENFTSNGGVYGYVYHIYNRKTNMHYIGQTVYMPFFRWQEHVKSAIKGDITDLIFETITEVRVKSQEYLNNIEAWWIKKFIEDYGRDNVMNLMVPKITIQELIDGYSRIVEGQMAISFKIGVDKEPPMEQLQNTDMSEGKENVENWRNSSDEKRSDIKTS